MVHTDMPRATTTDEIDVLIRRKDVLDRLCRSPAHIRDLVDDLEQSRSTVKRAVNELESIDLVERGDGGIEATVAGRLAREQLETLLSTFDDVRRANSVLEPLPSEADIDPAVVAGSEAIRAANPTPYRALERIHDDLSDASRYRALVTTLYDPRHVGLLYEQVVTAGNPVELVVSPAVFRTLRAEFPRRTAAMAEEERFSVFVGAVPPYGLDLFEYESSSEGPPATSVNVVIPTEWGGVHGVLANHSELAVTWAENKYATYRREATDRTRALVADSDGGVRAVAAGDPFETLEQSLPVSLEREGFVSIDVSYFRDEPVADPATAWRTALSLSEVHTGYAVERSRTASTASTASAATCASTDGTDSTDSTGTDDRQLTSTITAELAAGTDCLVLGPPGSGKSTLCKQVACGWYDADRGPVLYREGDRGRALTSVDDLVTTVTRADGHALVVVEDAVRPDASTVFEVLDRLADRDDVSILLDARETEWRDRSEQIDTAPDLSVTYVPPIHEVDCERLVAHFERTVGKPVDVPPERLWAAVRDDVSVGGSGGPNEMLRLTHRLAAFADPLADGPTALEEAVASVYDELADDDAALSVCILVNALNAAGLGVDRGLCYAATDVDDLDAALDRLDGDVIFSRTDGRYRTVHEEWSTTFLAHLLEAEGEGTAARRFGTAISGLLALADRPERCERITTHPHDHRGLAAVIDDPAAWATETATAIYGIGRDRPKLGPLFGDGASDSIELPAVVSNELSEERPVWLGQLFAAGGYFDRAERAFERLSLEETESAVERLLGLANVFTSRGAYDDATAACQECLSLVETDDRPIVRARARLGIGDTQFRSGRFGDAREQYLVALDDLRTVDDRRWTAKTLHKLGAVSQMRGEYTKACEFYESSLELTRQIGDRRDESGTLTNLGTIAARRGEFDRANRLFERSLELKEALGDRAGAAIALNNLGRIPWQQGEYDRARRMLERSLELYEVLDDRARVAGTLNNLGEIARLQDRYDRATELFERSLELAEETGSPITESSSLNNLGLIAKRRGTDERAGDYFERGLEVATACGDSTQVATNQCCLAALAIEREDFDRAHDRLETALDAVEDEGSTAELHVRLTSARLALEHGDFNRARSLVTHTQEEFEASPIPYWGARSSRLRGRIAAAAGDDESAREHLLDALESFAELGAFYDALETIRTLVETGSGGDEHIKRWHRRARELLSDAPPVVREAHQEWVAEFSR